MKKIEKMIFGYIIAILVVIAADFFVEPSQATRMAYVAIFAVTGMLLLVHAILSVFQGCYEKKRKE